MIIGSVIVAVWLILAVMILWDDGWRAFAGYVRGTVTLIQAILIFLVEAAFFFAALGLGLYAIVWLLFVR